jgi:hypothetical protein
MSYGTQSVTPAARAGQDKVGSPLAAEAELARTRESLGALKHLASLVGNRAFALHQAVEAADPAKVEARVLDTAIACGGPIGLALDHIVGVAMKALGYADPLGPPPCTAPTQSSST